MFYAVGRALCALFFWSLFGLRAKGRDLVPRTGAYILAGNHASFLDPVAFGVACPRQINYLARKSLFRNRVFGWILKMVHVIPLKRGAADLGAMKEALRRLEKGEGLLLFPEGTRTETGELGRGHHGVGFLARKAGVPVIPAYVHGTFEALPKGAKGLRPARVTVVFGPALRFEGRQELSDQDIADRIMAEIKRLKDSHFS